MITEGGLDRDLAALVVPPSGRLVATGDRYEPYQLGFITLSRGLADGRQMAVVDWAAAITALAAGHLPCSGGEQRMLRLIASIAGGIPADLQDILTGIDDHNIQLLLKAVLHASGKRPLPQLP